MSRPSYRLQLHADEEVGKFIEDVSGVKFDRLDTMFPRIWTYQCISCIVTPLYIFLGVPCRTCTLQTTTPQPLLTTVSWCSTTRAAAQRRILSVPSSLRTLMRSRTLKSWITGDHVSVGWLTCTQVAQRRMMTQKHCQEKQNGSDMSPYIYRSSTFMSICPRASECCVTSFCCLLWLFQTLLIQIRDALFRCIFSFPFLFIALACYWNLLVNNDINKLNYIK